MSGSIQDVRRAIEDIVASLRSLVNNQLPSDLSNGRSEHDRWTNARRALARYDELTDNTRMLKFVEGALEARGGPTNVLAPAVGQPLQRQPQEPTEAPAGLTENDIAAIKDIIAARRTES
jgi:hypothetical protein